MSKKEKYPMGKLSTIEKELYEDIIKTITKKKYHNITADKTLIIFGRVYSTYILSHLKENNILKMNNIKTITPKIKIEYCEKCMQMTNHEWSEDKTNRRCLKCNNYIHSYNKKV